MAVDLQAEALRVLRTLVRFNTVNPPGRERPALEWLERYLSDAGLECRLLALEPERPNLVARLRGPDPGGGPTLGYLGHVDTVLADPAEWARDPWAAEVDDEGFVWGRGTLDMKGQVACEAAAAAVLARSGWRPPRGELLLVFVSDEEAGSGAGAKWLVREHPDLVRCDFLLNEGGGELLPVGDRRLYPVCCAEKGTFRFTVTTHGVAGHASYPGMGDNALLKMTPILDALARRRVAPDLTAEARALLSALGFDPEDPLGALERARERDPRLAVLVEPLLGVTLVPTQIAASEKINVVPSRARLHVDCRVPPGLGREAALTRARETLGDGDYALEFQEGVVGNRSPMETPLMDAIGAWLAEHDPGAETVPAALPGFTDSRWFREAFPDCIAYGFCPRRRQTVYEAVPLWHSADERAHVDDVGFAAGFFADLPRRLLGDAR